MSTLTDQCTVYSPTSKPVVRGIKTWLSLGSPKLSA